MYKELEDQVPRCYAADCHTTMISAGHRHVARESVINYDRVGRRGSMFVNLVETPQELSVWGSF